MEEMSAEEKAWTDALMNMQIDFIKALNAVMEKHGEIAYASGVSLNQVAFSIGSATASVVYEHLRTDDQTTATPENVKYLEVCQKDIGDGFGQKLETLQDPQKFKEACSIGEVDLTESKLDTTGKTMH